MFNRNNRCHSITDICTCKIRIFIFQNANLSGISIHHCSKGSFKSCKVCTAFCIVNIVAESKYILPKLIGKLEGCLYLNSIRLSFQINRFMEHLCILIQVLNKSDNPIRFMICDILNLSTSFIFKMYRQLRIQISSFMKSALYFCRGESCLFKNLRIRQEINTGPCLSGPSQLWQKSLFQLQCRNSSFIMIVMYISVAADFDIQICRQSIDNRGTYSVKSSAGLVG